MLNFFLPFFTCTCNNQKNIFLLIFFFLFYLSVRNRESFFRGFITALQSKKDDLCLKNNSYVEMLKKIVYLYMVQVNFSY